ncbi:hypothetical protein [Caenispirillum bisanense]|uniref:hypothetical protein n=1 Tax=Caenispirillum bisanense TaxID=414052 RepID=UPI0031D62722
MPPFLRSAVCLLLASAAAVPLAACTGAKVVGKSPDAILLRVADEGAVAGSRSTADSHCARRGQQAVLVSSQPLGEDVIARWECR